MIHRPAISEYPPYFETYIQLVQTDDLLQALDHNSKQINANLKQLTEEQAAFRYAPGKWSLKEVVGHMIDTERIMSYRALCIARGDATSFPGFDENAYVSQSAFDDRTLASLLQDFIIVRQATISLLSQLPLTAWDTIGTVNSNKISVRALGFIIAGHELHHCRTINERYISTF